LHRFFYPKLEVRADLNVDDTLKGRLEQVRKRIAVFVGAAVIWGLTTVIARQPKDASLGPASVDAMQRMRNAINLPVERYDAY